MELKARVDAVTVHFENGIEEHYSIAKDEGMLFMVVNRVSEGFNTISIGYGTGGTIQRILLTTMSAAVKSLAESIMQKVIVENEMERREQNKN